VGDLRFEWDTKKASSNERKHGVTFDEAKSVFSDENALVIPDPDHSQAEDRFIILGMSSHDRALVVVHCFREEGAVSLESFQHDEPAPKNRNLIGRINHESRV